MSIFNVKVLTIFPEMFPGPLGSSVVGNALSKNLWDIKAINIRDFAEDKHSSVDDYPMGGGSGMLMKPDVLGRSIEHAYKGMKKKKIIYLSPRGKMFNQKIAKEIVESENVIMLCGRYEGVDQRVIDHYEIEEISLGDYVISGGELAAYVVIDSCVRLVPGVLKDDEMEESFALDTKYEKLLEYPQYTRPREWKDIHVPEVLLSGDHKKIDEWRLEKAKEITKKHRPDLLK